MLEPEAVSAILATGNRVSLHIADTVLGLSLGAGAVRCAGARQKTPMLGSVSITPARKWPSIPPVPVAGSVSLIPRISKDWPDCNRALRDQAILRHLPPARRRHCCDRSANTRRCWAEASDAYRR
jgi:hypothetical protein